eukprot:PhF_6_TR27486/c0_g1_i1/m.40371
MIGFPEKYYLAKRFMEDDANVSSGPPLSDTDKLAFYALSMQADIGPCDRPAPSMWNLTEYYKHSAWAALGKLSKMEAMVYYTQQVDEKFPAWVTRVTSNNDDHTAVAKPNENALPENFVDGVGESLPQDVPALQSLVIELRQQVAKLKEENESLRQGGAVTVHSRMDHNRDSVLPHQGNQSVVVKSDGTYYTTQHPRMGWLQWLGISGAPQPPEQVNL